MSFSTETAVKAVRKRHRCDGCGAHIEIGEPASRWAGLTDGDFGTAIYHLDCRAAEIALNRLLDAQWGEWTGLCEIEDEDRPWLAEKFPAVAGRMGFAVCEPEAQGLNRDEASTANPQQNQRSEPLSQPGKGGA